MNTIRALDFVLEFLPEPTGDIMVAAQNHLRSLVSQYDAIAPTPEMWKQAPSWVQWYAIDACGDGKFREKEPTIFNEESRWYGIPLEGHIDSVLPLGIDWRLCKWQRPEAAG